MITGMPSGLVLVLSWAFGIYTRLTATGRHELRVACTCTATSARAWAVNATRPSIPAVARPALRCVTCRTLISVFDQLRNMSFCRFLALARSPSGAPGTRPGIRPVIRPPSRRRTWSRGRRFPVVFRPPAFASWAPCPAGKFRPDHSRPTTTAHAYLRTRCGPRRGFTTFHTRETRTGPGALYTPRMTVFAGHRVVRGRRLPPHNGRSLPPRYRVPARDVGVTRH